MHGAAKLFLQLSCQGMQVVPIIGIAFAAWLLKDFRTTLAHQQYATCMITNHRRDNLDFPQAHSRVKDHDCMRPSLYGITP